MEEYARLATEEIERQLSQGINPAIYNGIKYYKMAKLISAFPGTGKTYYFNNGDKTILDSDSSTFDKSDFPANYIRHIKENRDKAEVILVSSHKEVRDALVKEGLEFTLVYPKAELKREYMKRFEDRDSHWSFCALIEANWDTWIMELRCQMGCNHRVLNSGEYLSDIFTSSGTP